jgi:hypothetical protein
MKGYDNIMAEETTSSEVSATQQSSDTPATGTASTSATLQKSTLTSEEALKARIAELERHAANKEDEAARHGKSLTAAEKELAAYKEKERQAQEATLSEIDKATKRANEADKLVQQYKQQLINAQVKMAAQSLGIIDPDIAALAVNGSLEYGDDGLPSNVDDALKTLIKNKPYLVAPKAEKPAAQPEVPATPAQTAQPAALQTPQIPAMNPGRSSIASPGSTPPGSRPRIPTLADVYQRQQ